MTKSILSPFLAHALAATLPMLAAVCAGPASAQSVEGSGPSKVMMFDRPPSVEELREVVAPEPKIRTRSIEIIGGAAGAAAKRPRPIDEINYGTAPIPPAAQPAPQYNAQPTAQPAAQPAPSRPAQKQRRQEARMEAPAAEPPPAAQAGEAPQAFGFRINFALNSAEIPADSASYIDAVGALMKEDPNLGLTVEGHTDASGSLPYNLLLSQRRAVSVGEYLVRVHQIDPKRITVDGKGPTAPLAANPYDGRNRRVEFKPTR
ncbi:OmpA family protein [Azospirillum sp. BE72]|uniref:OmpA family protein n=1 Tax=Azospirillum sp. BE72 TaxID=2817776 RepID=UPI00285F9CB6|nr:OmpA family protein [Azospirillum sp. BE72]MDR6772313.1 outer membrane protein OmpA-like peptidoglycan-associated protein [Azospirillum sp. BE72]